MLVKYNVKSNFVAVEWDFRTLFNWISSSKDHGYIGATDIMTVKEIKSALSGD